MKHDDKWGWKMAWSGIGLIVAGWLLQSLEVLGLEGIPYYIVVVALCLIYVVAIYIVVKKFFSKKK